MWNVYEILNGTVSKFSTKQTYRIAVFVYQYQSDVNNVMIFI